jgi:hypothetical protein
MPWCAVGVLMQRKAAYGLQVLDSFKSAASLITLLMQVVPLTLAGRKLGVLCLSSDKRGSLTPQILQLAHDYGAQLAQVLLTVSVQHEKLAGWCRPVTGSCLKIELLAVILQFLQRQSIYRATLVHCFHQSGFVSKRLQCTQ